VTCNRVTSPETESTSAGLRHNVHIAIPTACGQELPVRPRTRIAKPVAHFPSHRANPSSVNKEN